MAIFILLTGLYGLGSWLASQHPSLLDAKTTKEGFLEVSKILGDPRTTPHLSSAASEALAAVPLTKDIYASRWIRAVDSKCQNKGNVTETQRQSKGNMKYDMKIH